MFLLGPLHLQPQLLVQARTLCSSLLGLLGDCSASQSQVMACWVGASSSLLNSPSRLGLLRGCLDFSMLVACRGCLGVSSDCVANEATAFSFSFHYGLFSKLMRGPLFANSVVEL